ncbi:MAG TPA: hypothetical protein PKD59_10530, partial [Miltoncostaeaceae bacterium]|nr:hypothetical protein [Miltoncostaeaceae bacterium]
GSPLQDAVEWLADLVRQGAPGPLLAPLPEMARGFLLDGGWAGVGAGAAGGGGGARELSLDRIAGWLEDAPAAGAALDGGAAERARRDMPEADAGTGPAAARRARADEVHHAVHALRLAGELAAEEPDRLQLPGFGPSTWRAIGILREGDRGPAVAWAAAVADPAPP